MHRVGLNCRKKFLCRWYRLRRCDLNFWLYPRQTRNISAKQYRYRCPRCQNVDFMPIFDQLFNGVLREGGNPIDFRPKTVTRQENSEVLIAWTKLRFAALGVRVEG